jgi:hypothetical protein
MTMFLSKSPSSLRNWSLREAHFLLSIGFERRDLIIVHGMVTDGDLSKDLKVPHSSGTADLFWDDHVIHLLGVLLMLCCGEYLGIKLLRRASE